jgi:AcrR family transcriptional regulator
VRTRRFRSEATTLNKRSRTRALLMDAAVTVLARKGVEATSVAEVTATAELSNGIFYYHFRDKAELVEDVGRSIAAAIVNQVDDALRDVENGAERVAFAAQHFIRLGATEPEWGWLVVQALRDLGPLHSKILRGVRKDVAIGIAQGLFDVELSDMLLTSVLAVVGVALRTRLEKPKSGPELETGTAETILRMLGVPAAEAHRLPRAVRGRFPVLRGETPAATEATAAESSIQPASLRVRPGRKPSRRSR